MWMTKVVARRRYDDTTLSHPSITFVAECDNQERVMMLARACGRHAWIEGPHVRAVFAAEARRAAPVRRRTWRQQQPR